MQEQWRQSRGQSVVISLDTAYLICHLARGELDARLAIEEAIREVPLGRFQEDLLRQAHSGMRDTLLHFVRPELDMRYAAVLSQNANRIRIQSLASTVGAGAFRIGPAGVTYYDHVWQVMSSECDVLSPRAVSALLSSLRGWQDTPAVEVQGAGHRALLRLSCGVEHRLVSGDFKTQIQVWKVTAPEHASKEDGAQTPQPRCELLAHCQAMAHQTMGSWVVLAPTTESLIELHAACVMADEMSEPDSLWLHLQNEQMSFISPLPDLLCASDSRTGWYQPTHWIREGLSGASAPPVQAPAWAVSALMGQLPWVMAARPEDSACCAWLYGRESQALQHRSHSLISTP